MATLWASKNKWRWHNLLNVHIIRNSTPIRKAVKRQKSLADKTHENLIAEQASALAQAQ